MNLKFNLYDTLIVIPNYLQLFITHVSFTSCFIISLIHRAQHFFLRMLL